MKNFFKSLLPVLLLLSGLVVQAQHRTYYISPSGNDANDGLSSATAWATIARVNAVAFQAGDQVLFEGGQQFSGTIIPAGLTGTSSDPVVYSSYGTGAASINAGNGRGFFAQNLGDIELRNLNFTGSGTASNTADGVYFTTGLNTNLDHVVIDHVEVSGFRDAGVVIGSDGQAGFTGCSLQNCSAHDNGRSGILVFAMGDAYVHSGLYIGHCTAYNNQGLTSITTVNTGNGIVVANTDQALVEYCTAYNNGYYNSHMGGGPVGIWTYNGKNVVIQYCESHHNKAGFNADGGGFDIDGGSQNCTIRYCYSHDNEGAGFGMFEYGSTNEYKNNIIKYNISQNDGRKNSFGALAFWSVDNTHPLRDCQVYNNTFYIDHTGVVGGNPSAVMVSSGFMSGVRVTNNIFYVADGLPLLTSTDAPDTTQLHFFYNDYFATAANSYTWNGTDYSSLQLWRQVTGQETDGAQQTGWTVDPLLVAPGTDGSGYHLMGNSPLVGLAQPMTSNEPRDYYGTPLNTGNAFDVGAAQHTSLGAVLPVRISGFGGSVQHGDRLLTWHVANEDGLLRYDVQRSADGQVFTTIGEVPASGLTVYQYRDVQLAAVHDYYYRLAALDRKGAITYSKVIRLQSANEAHLQAFYDGAALVLRIDGRQGTQAHCTVYDSGGRALLQRSVPLQGGGSLLHMYEAAQWPRGRYFIRLSGETEAAAGFQK